MNAAASDVPLNLLSETVLPADLNLMAPGAGIRLGDPELPPLAELLPLLQQIWAGGHLSNNGPQHLAFEASLRGYLGVDQLSLYNNASTALMAALRTLGRRGEIITTPFSFVATANAIDWAGFTPVFADIDPVSLNLCPVHAEALITPDTVSLLPVHCFGTPCDTAAFADLAQRHSLPLVYDAAHAFGVRQAGHSLLAHGDLSVVSFHATKVFQTFEGGAIVCRDPLLKQRLDRLKNHGIVDESTFGEPGLNGKMNEFSAALGLLQLRSLDAVIARRSAVDRTYRLALAGIDGIRCLPCSADVQANHAYFPILVEPHHRTSRDALMHCLREQGVGARRYFWPLISQMPAYRHLPSARPQALVQAHRIADQILCLPIHSRMTGDDVGRIAELVAGS